MSSKTHILAQKRSLRQRSAFAAHCFFPPTARRFASNVFFSARAARQARHMRFALKKVSHIIKKAELSSQMNFEYILDLFTKNYLKKYFLTENRNLILSNFSIQQINKLFKLMIVDKYKGKNVSHWLGSSGLSLLYNVQLLIQCNLKLLSFYA